ncbi:MAG: hypothetical protein WC628_01675 [Candidatus Omnitrophota bacterium]
MEEAFKTRLIVISAILNVIFLVGLIGSCNSSSQQKAAWRREMLNKLDAEDKLNKSSQEQSVYSEKLKLREKDLEEEKAAHAVAKKALVQEQLVSQSLKDELQKVVKLKEALEEELKNSLVQEKQLKPAG